MARKTCVLCKHFHITTGERGYSEYTPGWDMSMSCSIGHWKFDSYSTDELDFREMMASAEACGDFEKYNEVENEQA